MALISTLIDDFNGTTLDTTKWALSGTGTYTVANSLFNATPNAGFSYFLSAKTKYTLAASTIYYKPAIPASVYNEVTTNVSSLYLQVASTLGSGYGYANLEIRWGTGTPTVRLDVAYSSTSSVPLMNVFSVTWNPTTMVYLRMRAASNTVRADYSADGVTWTDFGGGSPGTDWVDQATVSNVVMGWSSGSGVARTVPIDGINTLGPKLIETLTDDFSGASLDTTKWTSSGGVSGSTGQSGGLFQQAVLGGARSPTLASVSRYTLTNSSVYVRLYPPPNGTNSYTAVTVASNLGTGSGQAYIQHAQSTNQISFYSTGSTSTTPIVNTTLTYDSFNMRFLRFRQASTMELFFGYSANGSSWTEISGGVLDWGSSNDIRFSVLFDGNVTTQANNYIDNVNTLGTVALTASPTGVNDADTVTGPTATSAITTSPTGLNDTDTVAGPVAGLARLPTGINDPETVTGPTLTIALAYQPTGVNDIQTLGTPSASYAFSAAPTGVNDSDALDPGNQLYDNVYNNGLYGAGVYGQTPAPYPAGAGDPETVTGPSITTAYTLAPTGINDAQSLAQPAVPIPDVLQPAALGDPETISGPTLMGPPMSVAPGSVNDADSATAPATAAAQGSMIYGGGVYGDGLYSGWATSPGTAYPNALGDAETLGVTTTGGTGDPVVGTPANNGYGSGTYGTGLYNTNPATSVSPTSIGDPETLDGVGGNIPVAGTNNTLGSGVYGTGVYGGPAATVPVSTNDSTVYGAGDYGAGIYYGQSASTTPDNTPAVPLFPASLSSVPLVPMHLLGIGPWSPYVVWGGVSNRGITRSLKPAKPIIVMPPATALSITLRLVGGCEATADFSFPRGRAVIIEEMHTDLWWRRKDPYTGRLEVLGRFNAGTNDLSSDGEQISSSVHFVDYETLLSERMLLKYKDTYTTSAVVSGKTVITEHQQTQWPLGTKVTDILRFCIPTNMGLDLGVLAADADTDLGVIRVPWSTPPDATMADIFTNVLAVSSKQWEWWVQQPADVGLAPVLRFIVGTRGEDNGVVLFDIGAGPSPIASWNMTAATSTYANALYFEGASGGVVVTNAEQIDQYGQRDAHDGDSTLNGALAPIVFAADKKLNELADRRPTFSVVLKPGFWQGRSHIDIGDDVRLYIRLGSEVLDYRYRVTELALAIDQDGTETVTLTLGTPLSSADPRSRRSPILRVVRKLLNYAAPPHSNDQGAYDPTI